MADIVIGQSAVIRASFREPTVSGQVGALIDPASVAGKVIDASGAEEAFTPVQESTGVYYYNWVPLVPGKFRLQFLGTFSGATPSIRIIEETFMVLATATSSNATYRLGENYFTTLIAEGLTPLHVDPDFIMALFPEALFHEVVETIHFVSLEVDEILDGKEMTHLAYEYAKAAVACHLSRVYEYMSEEGSLTLGDLAITNRAFPKEVNRGTATSWCEVAATLRSELVRGRAGIKAIVKGSNYSNPMPKRHLRDKDGRSPISRLPE